MYFLVRFEPLRLQRSATFHVLGAKDSDYHSKGFVHIYMLCDRTVVSSQLDCCVSGQVLQYGNY